jgi:hypothetical protein
MSDAKRKLGPGRFNMAMALKVAGDKNAYSTSEELLKMVGTAAAENGLAGTDLDNFAMQVSGAAAQAGRVDFSAASAGAKINAIAQIASAVRQNPNNPAAIDAAIKSAHESVLVSFGDSAKQQDFAQASPKATKELGKLTNEQLNLTTQAIEGFNSTGNISLTPQQKERLGFKAGDVLTEDMLNKKRDQLVARALTIYDVQSSANPGSQVEFANTFLDKQVFDSSQVNSVTSLSAFDPAVDMNNATYTPPQALMNRIQSLGLPPEFITRYTNAAMEVRTRPGLTPQQVSDQLNQIKARLNQDLSGFRNLDYSQMRRGSGQVDLYRRDYASESSATAAQQPTPPPAH